MPAPSPERTTPPLEQEFGNYCMIQAQEGEYYHPHARVPFTPNAIEDRARASYELLQPVDSMKTSKYSTEEAAMTVCIPVALMQEDQTTIIAMLRGLQKSQRKLGQPLEVILWTNTPEETQAPKNPGFRQRIRKRRAITKIQQRYQNLRDALHQFDGSGVRIKTALDMLPDEGTSISQIRSNYMEAVALNVIKQGYGEDHPILWLDADTTYIAENTLGAINKKVRDGDTLFVHANERYTTEWAKGVPVSERDEATQAIMVNEMYRRKFVKRAVEQGERVGYPEESGLAFTIGTYLKLGGINTYEKVDEASNLLSYGKELLLNGEVLRLNQRHTSLPRNVQGLIEYLPSARIGISARRQYKAVQAFGAKGIRYAQQAAGEEYALFSSTRPNSQPVSTDLITREDMHRLLRQQRSRYGYKSNVRNLDEKDNRIVAMAIEKAFKD